MTRWLAISLVVALVAGGGYLLLSRGGMHMNSAWAQSWGGMGGGGSGGGCPMAYQGTPGGGDFAPQRGYNQGPAFGPQGGLSVERARDIVANQLSRLNPAFQVGQSRDAGAYYEFDVLSQGQTVDRLAVDKRTGMIRPLQ